MSTKRFVAASVTVFLAATTLAVAPASAQQGSTAAGTTESTQAVLDLDLGSLLDLELLTERATADLTNASSALSKITGLSVASGLISALNVSFPEVLAQQPGGAASDHESLSLGGTLASLVPSLGSLGTLIDSAGVAGGDVLNLNVGALAEAVRSAATGATELVRLDILSGVLGLSGVTSGLLQGSDVSQAAVARSMHVDALSVLGLGSLFDLLGVPLPSLSLTDLGSLVSGLGVVVEGLPAGETLAGFVQPLLDTLETLLNDLSATLDSLTSPVLDVLGGLLGGVLPGGDTLVADLPDLQNLVTDLVDQIVGILTGVLGDLTDLSLLRLNAIDLSAVAKAVGTTAGSSAHASCSLGSIQVASLPAIDLSAVTNLVGQVGALLSSLPLGLGDILQLSVCGVAILGPSPTADVESVGVNGAAVESRASSSAIHIGVNPGAVLRGLTGGQSVGDLLGSLGVPALDIPGLLNLDALLGEGNVLANGLSLDVGRVTARATYAASVTAIPDAPQAPAAPDAPTSLPTTGGGSLLPMLLAVVLLPLALLGRRLALARVD